MIDQEVKKIINQVFRSSDVMLDLAEINKSDEEIANMENRMWRKLGPTTKPPKSDEWPVLCRCKSCGKTAPHGQYQLRNNYTDKNGNKVFAFRTRHYWCPECNEKGIL